MVTDILFYLLQSHLYKENKRNEQHLVRQIWKGGLRSRKTLKQISPLHSFAFKVVNKSSARKHQNLKLFTKQQLKDKVFVSSHDEEIIYSSLKPKSASYKLFHPSDLENPLKTYEAPVRPDKLSVAGLNENEAKIARNIHLENLNSYKAQLEPSSFDPHVHNYPERAQGNCVVVMESWPTMLASTLQHNKENILNGIDRFNKTNTNNEAISKDKVIETKIEVNSGCDGFNFPHTISNHDDRCPPDHCICYNFVIKQISMKPNKIVPVSVPETETTDMDGTPTQTSLAEKPRSQQQTQPPSNTSSQSSYQSSSLSSSQSQATSSQPMAQSQDSHFSDDGGLVRHKTFDPFEDSDEEMSLPIPIQNIKKEPTVIEEEGGFKVIYTEQNMNSVHVVHPLARIIGDENDHYSTIPVIRYIETCRQAMTELIMEIQIDEGYVLHCCFIIDTILLDKKYHDCILGIGNTKYFCHLCTGETIDKIKILDSNVPFLQPLLRKQKT